MATKRKSGPIASATRMITGVGEYVMSPVKKLGGKVDRELGRAIGHNPDSRDLEAYRRAEASYRNVEQAYKNGTVSKAVYEKARHVFSAAMDRVGLHVQIPNPSRHNPAEFDTEKAAKAYARLLEHEGKKVKVEKRWGKGWDVVVASSNPKDPSNMSASEINKALVKVDAEGSKITHQFIEAGRGNERPSEYLKLDDPLSRKALANYRLRMDIVNEIERRAGPGMRTLPRGFGPIKRNKRNPESDAASMYSKFHGKDSETIAEFIEEEHYHGNLASLGQLIELKVYTITGLDATFCFDYEGKPSKGVILASNEEGTALYIVGGDQSLDLASVKMDKEDYLKDSMVIGDCYFVSYFTEKDFDKFQPTIYEHELGEETGELPVLRYDRLNERIYIDGGAYVIKKPLMRTSDGIEN